MNSYFNGKLSDLLSGFRQGYSTQHALFRATETWKRCLDTNGIATESRQSHGSTAEPEEGFLNLCQF